jgi:hypothetical protein
MSNTIGFCFCLARMGYGFALLLAAFSPVTVLAQDIDPQRDCNAPHCQFIRSEATLNQIRDALRFDETPWTPQKDVAFDGALPPPMTIASLAPANANASPARQDPAAPNRAVAPEQITLDASAGVTLEKLLSQLDADVEWGNDSLAQIVITGSYSGTRAAIARKALENFSFAIFHDNTGLHVIVMRSNRNDATTQEVARNTPLPPQPRRIIRRANDTAGP